MLFSLIYFINNCYFDILLSVLKLVIVCQEINDHSKVQRFHEDLHHLLGFLKNEKRDVLRRKFVSTWRLLIACTVFLLNQNNNNVRSIQHRIYCSYQFVVIIVLELCFSVNPALFWTNCIYGLSFCRFWQQNWVARVWKHRVYLKFSWNGVLQLLEFRNQVCELYRSSAGNFWNMTKREWIWRILSPKLNFLHSITFRNLYGLSQLDFHINRNVDFKSK